MASSKFYKDGYALLVGLNYHHWDKPLRSPLKDVDGIKRHILDGEKAGFNPENVIVLAEAEATAKNIISALDSLIRKADGNPNASVMFYYSGHGGNFNNQYFLVPYDFDLVKFRNSGTLNDQNVILAKTFAKKINEIRAKKILILLDCCHAENIPVEKQITGENFLNGFMLHLEAGLEQLAPSLKSLEAGIDEGSGRVIFTSCAADETSLDLGHLSLFTEVLLESLSGVNNIEEDGWVRLIDLMRYVPKTVASRAREKYGHKQNPVFKLIENLGSEDFIICSYNINRIKNLLSNKPVIFSPEPDEIYEIENEINSGNFSLAFARLDKFHPQPTLQYTRFKKEYSAGLSGLALFDFADRLKVYISDLKEKSPQPSNVQHAVQDKGILRFYDNLKTAYKIHAIKQGCEIAGEGLKKFPLDTAMVKWWALFHNRNMDWALVRKELNDRLILNISDELTTICLLAIFESYLNQFTKDKDQSSYKKLLTAKDKYLENIPGKERNGQYHYFLARFIEEEWWMNQKRGGKTSIILLVKAISSLDISINLYEEGAAGYAALERIPWWLYCHRCILLKLTNHDTFTEKTHQYGELILELLFATNNLMKKSLQIYAVSYFLLIDNDEELIKFFRKLEDTINATRDVLDFHEEEISEVDNFSYHHVDLLFDHNPEKIKRYHSILDNWFRRKIK